MVMLMLPLVSAEATTLDIPTFQQNTNQTVSIPCHFNGEPCPSGTTSCTGTILNPKGDAVRNANDLSQNGSLYSFNLTNQDLDTVGQYEFSVSCCVINNCEVIESPFFVTPSGARPLSDSQGMAILIIFAFLIGVNVLLYILGFRTDNVAMRYGFIALGVIMTGTLILYGLVLLNETVVDSPNLVAGLETIFMVYRVLFVVLGLLFIGILFAVVLKHYKIKRGLIDPD